jgi:hypothetical protein
MPQLLIHRGLAKKKFLENNINLLNIVLVKIMELRQIYMQQKIVSLFVFTILHLKEF